MSESPRVYCLPLLHSALEHDAVPCPPAAAMRLWPGLPNMPQEGYWAAASYPFDGATAQSCVRQMESLSDAALSGVPMQTLASMEKAPEVQKKRKEWRDIDKFSCSGLPPTSTIDSAEVLQAAQKALLWAWLLEEKILELKGIMGAYTDNAAHLMDALGVEADDNDTGLAVLASLDRALDNSSPMLPPWPMVLENAAIFLPDNALIAVNSEAMAADLRERLTFSPATEDLSALWKAASGCTAAGSTSVGEVAASVSPVAPPCQQTSAPWVLESASVPLWQALGKSLAGIDQRGEQAWRLKHFTFVLCGVQA